jgi:DNA-binding CsgD family transcriptional regulator
MTDFLGCLDAKLAKRNRQETGRLLAWGELLDAAGWCVALRLADGECWLGDRAKRALASPEVPVRWEEVLEKVDLIAFESFQVRNAGVRVWETETEGLPAVSPVRLTRREAEVLHWLRQGKTDPEMALILGCALRTVEKHVENLYRKLGTHERAEIILETWEER